MDINKFDDLLIRGFDMEFTYKTTFTLSQSVN